MTHCIYTGAKVWLQHDGSLRPADIYQIGNDVVVVRFNTGADIEWNYTSYADVAQDWGATHLIYEHKSPKGDWFRDDIGVIVTDRAHCVGEYHE